MQGCLEAGGTGVGVVPVEMLNCRYPDQMERWPEQEYPYSLNQERQRLFPAIVHAACEYRQG